MDHAKKSINTATTEMRKKTANRLQNKIIKHSELKGKMRKTEETIISVLTCFC